VPEEQIDILERHLLDLAAELGAGRFTSLQSPDFARRLLDDRELERNLYDRVRTYSWLADFALQEGVAGPAAELLGEPSGLMSKIPVRIDLPGVVRELAVWHQDFHYVRGNEGIVTAWIPLQDTPYIRGCLMVMPGSHDSGRLDHDVEVLGKRHFPSGVFHNPVQYVEMRRGDLLLFNSLLLHSSSLNMSDTVRLSIQARYSALSAQTDPSMGSLIPTAQASS
jgi:ectoine hydroxylase-related dioxygenase (phytanoyl-CoA dioxygenase family)